MHTTLLNTNKSQFIYIGIVSAVLVIIQTVLTRISSLSQGYHLTFIFVSFVMMGLTLGSIDFFKYLNSKISSQDLEHSIKNKLIKGINYTTFSVFLYSFFEPLFDINFFGNISDSIYIRIFYFIEKILSYGIVIYTLITGLRMMGYCIAAILTCYKDTNKLYAIDLICAALACIISVKILNYIDPLTMLCIIHISIIFIVGKKYVINMNYKTKFTVFLIAILSAFQIVTFKFEAPLFTVLKMKHDFEEAIYSRWNSYSHIGIYQSSDSPHGWGFGSNFDSAKYTPTKQYLLRIDADAATVLTKFDGDFKKVEYLKYDVTNFAYNTRKLDSVYIIGLGGGRDLLSALSYGAKKVTAVEFNPNIVTALTKDFYDFTGKISGYEGVEVVNAEARSYLQYTSKKYDLIQASLIDTWASSASGGMSLVENRLYTVEAWKEFYTKLNDHGVISMTRWMRGGNNVELYRLVSLAKETLVSSGIKNNFQSYVMAVKSAEAVNLMVSKSPFTVDDIKNANQAAQIYGLDIVISPEQQYDVITSAILEQSNSDIISQLKSNIYSPTDDKPYFFHFIDFSKILTGQFDNKEGFVFEVTGQKTVIFMLAMVFIFSFYIILFPMKKIYSNTIKDIKQTTNFVIYFASIGFGFMFVEISLMQRLSITLGHPIYAISVVLFSMLLFSGLGSLFYSKIRISIFKPQKIALMNFLMICLTAIYVNDFINYMSPLSHIIRIGLIVSFLALISFFMGMMFPVGAQFVQIRNAPLLPWLWGVNGVSSITGSILAAMTSMDFGISKTIMMGAFFYGLCVLCTFLYPIFEGEKAQDSQQTLLADNSL